MTSHPKTPHIVLAIDYGTTFSGLSWMHASDDGTFSDVNVFLQWPGGSGLQKVPSKISFSSAPGGKEQWGYSISEESHVLQWTKLELKLQDTTSELRKLKYLMQGHKLLQDYFTQAESNDPNALANAPRHICKSSEDIIREFTGRIAQKWYEYMIDNSRFSLGEVPLDVVITHPAEWPYEALNRTVRAVKQAFGPDMFPTIRHIYTTSEPEAAASCVIDDMVERQVHQKLLIKNRCFILVDAGGGTVDVATYCIDNLDPLKVAPIGVPKSATCGATFIDREFLQCLQSRIQGIKLIEEDYSSGGRFLVKPMGRVMLERFERWKFVYNGSGDEEVVIALPGNVTLTGSAMDELDSGTITLTNEDMRKIFSHSVDGTLKLLNTQLLLAQTQRRGTVPYQVQNIFLSGGFSENPYLFNQINAWAKAQPGNMQVQRAGEKSWTGVVRGAVLQGMGKGIQGTNRVRTCPRHYGIRLTQAFDYRHVGLYGVNDDFSGEKIVRNQVNWLIRQDDLIPNNRPLVKETRLDFRLTSRDFDELDIVKVVFVATDELDPPRNIKELPHDKRETIVVDIPLSKINRNKLVKRKKANGSIFGRYYWTAPMKVAISVADRVSITVSCCGKEVASKTVDL